MGRSRIAWIAAAFALVSSAFCHEYDIIDALPPSPMNFSDCDPLDPSLCMFPFPNNFWLRDTGAAAPTLYFSNQTFPTDWLNVPIAADVGGWNSLTGFSPIPSILTFLPNATLDGCPRLWDIAASLQPTSCTVLLDTVTGDLVPHWTELDHMSDDVNGYQAQRVFMIWPAQKLEHGRRYIVGIRGVTDTFGELVPSSQAFVDLRDNIPTQNWDIEGRRVVFKDIFARLTAVGVTQSSLQLAWDFTTGTRQNITGAMIHMRDDAFSRFPANGPEYVIDVVTDNFSSLIGRKIQGHFMVPWYLNGDGLIPWLNSRLVLGSDGLPVFQSFQPVNFTVMIPWAAMNATSKPIRVIQYGHGLFGDQDEVNTEYLQQQADEFGYIFCAVDWIGLSQYDEGTVGLMLATDLTNFAIIPDRLHQGMLNALSMMRFMRTSLYKDPLMTNTHTGLPFADISRVNYYGNSDGGIMGTVYMSLSTEVMSGCIGVGGGPFGLLPLYLILSLRYENVLVRPALLAVIQLLWDRLEPSGYVDSISNPANLLPGTPAHRVIFQYVTWLGTFQLARATNSSIFKSNVREGNETLFGVNFVDDAAQLTSGNLIMGWDFGSPIAPFVNQPANKSFDTHEKTRRELTAQAQMHTFFTTGTIVNTCKGACVNVTEY